MINPRICLHSVRMTAMGTGLIAWKGVAVQDWECVNTSFPGFIPLFESTAG